jgi:hypothetical protein
MARGKYPEMLRITMGPEIGGALDNDSGDPGDTGLDPVGLDSVQAKALSEASTSAIREVGERMGTSGMIKGDLPSLRLARGRAQPSCGGAAGRYVPPYRSGLPAQ